MRILEILTETLAVDVPNDEWLQGKIDRVRELGPDAWGVPRHHTVTAYTTEPVTVPMSILKRIPGARGEQNNVRDADLTAILNIMRDTGKLPQHDGREYVPFLVVTHDGAAWISEGNHRIRAAALLGWDSLRVDIRYFEGGERIRSGVLYPERLGL